MDEALHPDRIKPEASRKNGDPPSQVPTTLSLTDRVIAFVDARMQKVRTAEAWKARKAG